MAKKKRSEVSQKNIILRDYRSGDIKDLTAAGFRTNSTKFRFMFNFRYKVLDGIDKLESRFFTAYDTSEQKAVGIIILREITDELWGLWDIFVSPSHRGRRIATMLYDVSYDFVRKNNIKKAVGSVEEKNAVSIKSIDRSSWDGYISQKFYEFTGRISSIEKPKSDQYSVRLYNENDNSTLYKLYKSIAEKDWYTFLDIDQNSFLERFVEYPYYKGSLRRLFKKQILVIEKSNKIRGYALVFTHRVPFVSYKERIYLFISPKFTGDSACNLTRDFLNYLKMHGIQYLTIRSINTNAELLDSISKMMEKDYQFYCTTKLIPKKTF
jgi:GNAT superfamily N-acetyltransferase